MKTENEFDCVALKDEVQGRLRRELQGLSDEEQRARIRQELEASDSIVARKWRKCRVAASPASSNPGVVSAV